jgi:hypothetical protein
MMVMCKEADHLKIKLQQGEAVGFSFVIQVQPTLHKISPSHLQLTVQEDVWRFQPNDYHIFCEVSAVSDLLHQTMDSV